MERMTATDAQIYWMSAKIPNDQFLLFCFAGVRDSPDQIADAVVRRAEAIPDLRLRVHDVPATLDYPYWVPVAASRDQVRVHREPSSWAGCLDVLADLMADQLDIRSHAWRVHLIGPMDDALGAVGESSVVAVLQMAHALADGSRASSIARQLLDSRPLPVVTTTSTSSSSALWSATAAARGVVRAPFQLGALAFRAVHAHRAHSDLVADIDAGVMAAPPTGSRRTATNVAPGDRRALRVVVTDADRLREIGRSVTVGALVAIADALAAHLDLPPEHALRAEVTVAKPGTSRARNHFRNAGVDLCLSETDPGRRVDRIHAQLDQIRARIAHRLTAAESAAMAEVPAALLHWGAHSFDTTIVPDLVTGNTVVSSVDRGAADLVLGGGAVRFTAGFPALSPVQSLTHGVHGIGGTVAISITASPDVVPDLDGYRDRIAAALD